MVKEYVRQVRPLRRPVMEIRFETPPGQQAQADFGVFESFFEEEGRIERVSLFTMVLGHSRFLAGRYFLSQNLHSVLVGHLGAFEAFGGVPEEVLYDRMKTVVLGTEPGGDLVFHPALMALANHYGFRPRVCRPYRAKTKGKVERPIGYIRRDFFLGRTFGNLEDLNDQFRCWLSECANSRRHGTTGLIPAEELIKERRSLRALPQGSFDRLIVEERRTSRDGFISFGGNLYSVPDTTKSRRMELRVYLEHLEIREKDQVVAIHRLCEGKGKRVLDPRHRQNLWQRLKRQPEGERALFVQESGWPELQNPEALLHWGVEVERRDLSLYEELDNG
ncbi:MAG: IS21 family transposase [Deltaproteobacteria bacterium]|nr:IS21 family transposase [Deltaproteobacteria bacterium]